MVLFVVFFVLTVFEYYFTVKVYKDNLSNELTSKTQLQWLAGETQKEFSGFWVKIFNGERPPKPLVTLHNKKLSVRQVRIAFDVNKRTPYKDWSRDCMGQR